MKKLYYKALFILRNYFRRKSNLYKVSSMKLFADTFKSAVFLYEEIYLEKYYEFDLPKEGSLTIIDAGANMGWSSAYFKFCYPNAKIIAFEPNPVSADIFSKNMKINNFKNVELVQKALYSEDNIEVKFYISTREGSFRSSIFKDRAGSIEINVRTIKLSSIIQDLNKVDLLKIDVEGAESFIIEDLITNNVLSKVDNLIIELHHNPEKKLIQLSKVFKMLEDNEFKFNLKAYHSDFPTYQDVIIKASRKL